MGLERGFTLAMLVGAAAEQCAIRGGPEITVPDLLRAVALVAPDIWPRPVHVRTIDPPADGHRSRRETLEAREFMRVIFDSSGSDDEDASALRSPRCRAVRSILTR